MFSITIHSRIPPLPVRLVFWVLCASLLSSAFSAWAAEPILSKPDGSAILSGAFGRPPAAVPALPVYFLKIASLFMNGKRSEDESDLFSTFLDQRKEQQGWHGTVESTQNGFIELRQSCEKGGLYCDVIKINEAVTDAEMTISVMVFTTPEAHRRAHGGSEQQSPILPCPLKGFGENWCRETLMKMVVKQLAGMDKSHPLSSTGR